MPLIPQDIIDRILRDSDIVAIISEYTTLKKTGANYKACCPFHQEKTASFVVSPHKQIFHCFGCGVGGNVIGFLMQYEKMEFPDAAEMLAKRLSIRIERTERNPQQESLADKLYKINAYAHWFFQDHYKKSKPIKEYTQGRKLSEDVIKEFELGYAPDSFDDLPQFLASKRVPTNLSEQLGLIKRGKKQGHYAFFRNRLIFPIRNHKGKIIGFGGRALGNDDAKYINSSESPIYNKGQELYGLHNARKEISKKEQVIVVEGYIDVMACYQLEIPNSVAPLGTSLTENQISLLKRYAKEIVLMFDGDDAGKKAAIKSIALCLDQGIHPKVVLLPNSKDPGDYLPDQKAALQDIIEKAPEAMNWLIANSLEHVSKNPAERAKTLKFLMSWLGRLPEALEKVEFEKRICQFFAIRPEDLQKVVDITYNFDIPQEINDFGISLEAIVLMVYLDEPEKFGGSLGELSRDFEDKRLQTLATLLEDFLKKHETFDERLAIQELPQELRGFFSKLLLAKENIKDKKAADSSLKQYQKFAHKKKLKRITAEIAQAETMKETDKIAELLRQKQELYKKL